MRHDQGNEIASGAGYERLMSRIKSETRSVLRETPSFKKPRDVAENADGRAQFGKRRTFEL